MTARSKALAAVRAAKNYDRWGAFAATRYASRHGVSITMLCMALGFEQQRARRQGGAS